MHTRGTVHCIEKSTLLYITVRSRVVYFGEPCVIQQNMKLTHSYFFIFSKLKAEKLKGHYVEILKINLELPGIKNHVLIPSLYHHDLLRTFITFYKISLLKIDKIEVCPLLKFKIRFEIPAVMPLYFTVCMHDTMLTTVPAQVPVV